jgi:hypothetical protein
MTEDRERRLRYELHSVLARLSEGRRPLDFVEDVPVLEDFVDDFAQARIADARAAGASWAEISERLASRARPPTSASAAGASAAAASAACSSCASHATRTGAEPCRGAEPRSARLPARRLRELPTVGAGKTTLHVGRFAAPRLGVGPLVRDAVGLYGVFPPELVPAAGFPIHGLVSHAFLRHSAGRSTSRG